MAVVEAGERIQMRVAALPPAPERKWLESPKRLTHCVLNVAPRQADVGECPIIELGDDSVPPPALEGLSELLEKPSRVPSGGSDRLVSQQAFVGPNDHENF